MGNIQRHLFCTLYYDAVPILKGRIEMLEEDMRSHAGFCIKWSA